jgi:hypothetical protein
VAKKTNVAAVPSCCIGGTGAIKPLGGKLPATGSFFNSPATRLGRSSCGGSCCGK